MSSKTILEIGEGEIINMIKERIREQYGTDPKVIFEFQNVSVGYGTSENTSYAFKCARVEIVAPVLSPRRAGPPHDK